MNNTVFVELRFWWLVAFSIVIPIVVYWILLATRSIARKSVLFFGVTLPVKATAADPLE
jgi:hypothetical protein